MRLHSTLSGNVEELQLVTPGKLGLYVCGVTPYAESHVGHAMSLIVYDVLVRYLRWPGNSYGGLDVTYVSNYTDVEDKLIARGHELGIDPLDLANQNIAQWENEQRALGLVFPDVRPRVTQEIPAILALTERLVANGHAYATSAGDVYFRVRSDEDYGKLSHRNIEELRTGTRFEPGEEKEFPLDFALWKAAKPGEPSWPSPWGAGRPGWHIECSAMAQRYLGDTFDIHGGGLDLVFPHHENEVAQSESATGKPFARLWMHNGLVLRDGEKMSKSIGNVVSVHDALARWSPDAIRLFVLMSGYRTPNNLTDEAMEARTSDVHRLAGALLRESNGSVEEQTAQYNGAFVRAMEDNFNTARACAVLFEMVTAINTLADREQPVGSIQFLLRQLTGLFGLKLELATERVVEVATATERITVRQIGPVAANLDVVALSKLAKQFAVVCGGTDAPSTIEALLAHREEARRARDFAVADGIRNGLVAAGVDVEDTPAGPRWSAR